MTHPTKPASPFWQYRHFGALWSAQIVALVASYVLNFTLVLAVYNLTRHSPFNSFAVSLVVLAFTVPAFFVSPVAGAFADYWNRKKILVAVNALRVLLVFCYVPAGDNVPLILVLTILLSAVTQFFIPAEAAMVPQLVPKRLLLRANSLFITSIYVTFIAGFLLAGPLVGLGSLQMVYGVVAVLFVVATVLVGLLPRQASRPPLGQRPVVNPITQLRINWQIVCETRERCLSVVSMGAVQALMYILITIAPVLSSTVLGGGLEQNGPVLVIPLGIGLAVGMAVANLLPGRTYVARTIVAAFVCAGAALALLGCFAGWWVGVGGTVADKVLTAVVIFVFGALSAVITALAQTLLQRTTNSVAQGKVFGSLQLLIAVGAAAPIIFSGIMTDTGGVASTLLSLGGVVVLASLLAGRWVQRSATTQIRV